MNIKHIFLGTVISFIVATAFADAGTTGANTDALKGVKRFSAVSLRNNEISVLVPSGYSPRVFTTAPVKTLLMAAIFSPSESPSNWSEQLRIMAVVGSETPFTKQSHIDEFLSAMANRARSNCKDDFFVQFDKAPKFDRSYVQGCKRLDRAPDQSIYEFSTVALKNEELIVVSRVIKNKFPLESPLSIDDPRVTAIRAEVEAITLCEKNVQCIPQW